MATAIAAARQQINAVGADGDLDGATPRGEIDLDVDSVADPIELPDGKVIYPPKLHGQPIDTIACALLDMQQPSRSRFLRLIGPPGTGKALALNTPIATPTGWSTIGQLQVGDHVFAGNGRPTRVTATSPVMFDRLCLEVSFSDGSTIVADADHFWVTDRRSASGGWETCASPVTTTAIGATVRRHGKAHHAIAVAPPLALPESDLPIEPRVLGIWLGDGDTSYATVTTADHELLEAFTAAGYRVRATKQFQYTIRAAGLGGPRPVECLSCGAVIAPGRSRRWYCRACADELAPSARKLPPRLCACGRTISRESWSDTCRSCLTNGSLLHQLRDLGVLGNKHIPMRYLRASAEQRRRLLSGLLDADGTVSPSGAVEYVSTSARLAHDAHALICSLGYRAAIRQRRATLDGRDIGPRWTVSLTTGDVLFGLERKRLRHAERSVNASDARRRYRYITAVKTAASVPVRCIQVEHPSGLFLAGHSLIATHNSQIARAIAHRLWTRRGRAIETRHGEPFYGYAEMSGGPSSDEFTFRYEYVPDKDRPGDVRLIPAAFVEAMEHGWVVMIDEVNTIRDVALLSLNGTLDGRLSLYLPAEGRTVAATPGFAVLIAYNPGLVGASDIPDAWHSRFPATVEVTSNWPALVKLGAGEQLVKAAMALDAKRFDPETGLVWTPQFRDIEALCHMIELVGERAAVSLFISNLHEQIEAGKVQAAEGAAAARMLDEAGLGRLKVGGGIPNLHGYPRAVTR